MKVCHIMVFGGLVLVSKLDAQTFFIPNGNSGIGTSLNNNIGIEASTPLAKFQLGDFGNTNNNKLLIPGVYNFEQIRLGQYGNGACGLEFVNHTDLYTSYGIRFKANTDDGGFNGLQIQTSNIASSYEALNYTTKLAIRYDGKIGIGTTSPDDKLSIEDNNSEYVGLSVFNRIYGTNQGYFFLRKTGNNYVVTDQRNAGIVESYNDLILSAAMGERFYFPAIKFQTGRTSTIGNTRMIIDYIGNVGIGTTSPQNKLDVNGTIRAKEVKVTLDGWPDIVFKPYYKLKPLYEVERYININGHLPEIPSETEVKQNGVNVGDMQSKLLQKVEELTIYAIEQDKTLQEEKRQNTSLKKEIADQRAMYLQLLNEIKELKTLIKK